MGLDEGEEWNNCYNEHLAREGRMWIIEYHISHDEMMKFLSFFTKLCSLIYFDEHVYYRF